VHDQVQALDFYTKKLGMEVRMDVTLPEMGGFRWLTVGPVGQPDISITLMAGRLSEPLLRAAVVIFEYCDRRYSNEILPKSPGMPTVLDF